MGRNRGPMKGSYWDTLLLPKANGGLANCNLLVMNQACIMKLS